MLGKNVEKGKGFVSNGAFRKNKKEPEKISDSHCSKQNQN
jgi:hypothetical protein